MGLFKVSFPSKAVSGLRWHDNDFALREAINGSLEMALIKGTALYFQYFRHVCSMFKQFISQRNSGHWP